MTYSALYDFDLADGHDAPPVACTSPFYPCRATYTVPVVETTDCANCGAVLFYAGEECDCQAGEPPGWRETFELLGVVYAAGIVALIVWWLS